MALVILALGCFGLLTSTVFAGMVLAGGRHHWREKTGGPGAFAPPLTLLKPLHGDEPGLEAHLATFFEQDYPEYEILFCARDEVDAGLAAARRVAGGIQGWRRGFSLPGMRLTSTRRCGRWR